MVSGLSFVWFGVRPVAQFRLGVLLVSVACFGFLLCPITGFGRRLLLLVRIGIFVERCLPLMEDS